MLNMTKVELELMSDAGMWLFFRKGTGGGVSYIPKRYSKTNNKYLNSYNSKQESKHFTSEILIIYFVIQCLNFFQQEELNGVTKTNIASNSSKGGVSEVDLEYHI